MWAIRQLPLQGRDASSLDRQHTRLPTNQEAQREATPPKKGNSSLWSVHTTALGPADTMVNPMIAPTARGSKAVAARRRETGLGASPAGDC